MTVYITIRWMEGGEPASRVIAAEWRAKERRLVFMEPLCIPPAAVVRVELPELDGLDLNPPLVNYSISHIGYPTTLTYEANDSAPPGARHDPE